MSGVAVLSLLSMMWRPALAIAPATRPARGTAGGSAPMSDGPVDRLAPIDAQWLRPGGARSVAVLFDGDRTTVLRTGGDATIQVDLGTAETVRGIGVFGAAAGKLSISAVDRSGAETAIDGLQDLDLASLPLRWNRFWAPGGGSASQQLLLHWRPATPTADLRELEIFGNVVGANTARDPALADRLFADRVPDGIEAWADRDATNVSAADLGEATAATFPIDLPVDPRLIDRVFLVYELGGLPHWSAPLRQVNGFSVRGGFRADELGGGAAGVQVEELSPEWLFAGHNEISFLPPADGDPIGYRVGRVRLVAIPGTRASGSAAPAVAASGPAALADGDPRTGLRARDGAAAINLPLDPDAQPAGLTLRIGEQPTGRLLVATVRADGRTSAAQPIDTERLAPGWHNVPLGALPAGDAVRLSWDPGKEGRGLISEARLAASPAPDGRGRQLTVSYPLHGECVDHRVYVRGFVTGVAAESQRPQLLAGTDAVDDAIAADGAFAMVVSEPAAAKGQPWTIPLKTRFSDGQVLARDVPIDPCADRPLASRPLARSGPRPLIEDEGAPFGKTVQAAVGGVVEMGGVRLDIPAGALERDTRITVRPLVDGQIAPLDAMMDNVTPDRKGFRLGPHNLKFTKPVHLHVPYDRGLVPSGEEHGAPTVYFFDEESGRWQGLAAAEPPHWHELVAETTHFTDFIAATLAVPDHPSQASNTPNMVADMKLGDPTAGMAIMAPPTPANDGSANLTLPIETPPGRNGVQPNLVLRYNSNVQNGFFGVGWELPISHIEHDTRFGSSPFDLSFESDRYVLDGEELVMAGTKFNNFRCGDPAGTCDGVFHRRSEKSFDTIIRSSAFGDSGWTVTDKNGTVTEYGTQDRHPEDNTEDQLWANNESPPVYWSISRVTDTFGNSMRYVYHVNDDNRGINSPTINYSREMILDSITYTYGPNVNPGFRVMFEYAGSREDAFSNARLGVAVKTDHLVTGLRVEAFDVATGAWVVFRHYGFGYSAGEFRKALLRSVDLTSGPSATPFYSYKFNYKSIPRTNGRVQFGAPKVWAQASTAGALGQSKSSNVTAGGFVGLGPFSCYPHVGVGMSGSGSNEKSQETFVDVNGDGLPDILRADGTAQLNGFDKSSGQTRRDQGVFTSQAITAFGSMSQSANWSRTYGLGLHFPGEFGANLSMSSSHAEQAQGLADMNGDGFPDLFNGNSVQCNVFPGALPCGGSGTGSLPFSASVPWTGNTSDFPVFADPDPNSAGGSSFQTQMVLRWTAPYTGFVSIQNPVSRVSSNPTVVPDGTVLPRMDPVVVAVQARVHDDGVLGGISERFIWTHTFSATDSDLCYPQASPNNGECLPANNFAVNVTAGDEYFFVVSAPQGNVSNAVNWNPRIVYQDGSSTCLATGNPADCPANYTEPHRAPLFTYDMAADFRLAGGIARPWVTASADTRPNGSRPVPTIVRITGTINKRVATAEDVRFQVVRVSPQGTTTVVWPANGVPLLMAAGQPGTFVFDTANVTADVKGQWVNKVDANGHVGWTLDSDRLIFQAIADSPVDISVIDWKPVVTYTNYCYPDPVDQQNRYLATHTTPSPVDVATICTTNPASVIGGATSTAVQVQYPAFRYQPTSPDMAAAPGAPAVNRPQPIFMFNDTATHTMSFNGPIGVGGGPGIHGLNPDAGDLGQVVALIQTPGRLVKKLVIPVTSQSQLVPFNGSFTVTGHEPIYFTLMIYGNTQTFWQPTLSSGSNSMTVDPIIHVLAEPPLPGVGAPIVYAGRPNDPMAGGYHQWTYGVFNTSSGQAFQSSLISLNYNPNGQNPFFPATASLTGLSTIQPNLPAINGPLWRGSASDDYIGPGVFHASYTGSGSVDASLPGTGFRRAISNTVGGGVNVIGSLETNNGTTDSEIDLIDMNGDRIPDLVGFDRILTSHHFLDGTNAFSDKIGDVTTLHRSDLLPFGSIRHGTSQNSRWGLALGSIASQMHDQPSAGGSAKQIVSSVPSFGLAYGMSATSLDLIDMNGDGLPDSVSKVAGSNSLSVVLGLGPVGIASHRQFQYATNVWPMEALSANLSQSNQVTFAGESSDALRVQDTSSNSLQINIMGIGGGVAFGASRSMVDMIDMNGDGLPDRVLKQPGTDEMLVQMNLGSRFGVVESWAMPQWGAGPAIDNGGLANIGLGSNDALAFTQFRNTAISAGLDVPIPLFFVCLVIEAAAATDSSDSNTQMALEDIDGDGLPDQVFRKNDLTGGSSSTTVYAKLNPTGMANLLTHVDGPLGGSFDIEYGRAGNEVNIPAHIDDPHNHWVMTAVTVHRQGTQPGGQTSWNADPDQRSEFAYAGGFYSRADREFVGFKTITTTSVGEQSTMEETFDTSDVYHKGNLLKRVVRDKLGKVFEVEERQYDVRVVQAVTNTVLEPRAIEFVPERLRRFRSYEGGGTNPDAATLTREEARDYENTFGSMISYEDRGDTAVTTDDAKYTVGYYQDTAKHIIKPNLIVAKDAAGNVLSQRSATYLAANGKMDSLTDLLNGGRDANGVAYTGGAATNPKWQFGYNPLGNLQSTIDPNGYTVSVVSYDSQVQTYPVVLNDSFGYIWAQDFDRLTGEVADRTDPNETTTFIGHDVHERPISVAIGTVEAIRATITYAAAAADQSTPAQAQVSYANPEQSQTLSMVDGWGRLIQTKKKAVVDDGNGNPVAGLIVSGRQAFDSRGRLVSAGQPFFRAGQTPSSSTVFDNAATTNPTTFTYDVLSRQTQVTPPPGSGITTPAKTVYDLFTLAGSLRRRQTVTDFNGHQVTNYADARNRTVQVDQSNTIAGMPKVLSTKYDYDQLDRIRHVIDAKNNTTTADWDTMGRMIDQINPDTGKTIYDHDLAGNVARRQNANGQVNQYVYNFNRLEHVFYPGGTATHLTYGPTGASPDYGAGRVISRTDETGTDTFKYDQLGNVLQTVWTPAPPAVGLPPPASYTTTYTYDPVLSTVRSIAAGGETITYGYDVTGRVNLVQGQRGSTQTTYAGKILYNELAQRTRIELGNGAITKYVYEPILRRLKNVNTDAGGIAVQRLVYGYDSMNNVTTLANAVPPTSTTVPAGAVLPGPTSQTFGYDNLYQLTAASGTYTGVGSRGGRSYSLAMTYDEIGNIKSKNQKDTNVATVGGPPQPQALTTFNVAYTYGSTRPHAATAIGAQTSTFDLDGNQTSAHGSFGMGRDMTFNEEDRLKTDIQGGVTRSYLYHPNGERAIKRDTTTTYYPTAQLVDRPGARSTRQIMIGNQRIASVVSSTNGVINTFYYHSDQLQSSSYMTNGGGLLLQHDEYMPSGQTWVEEVRNGDVNNNRTSFLFNAKEQDDTGLYYFGGRYYDPVASQWLNPDPMLHSYLGGKPNRGVFNPQNISVYSYAYNNPMTVRDPSGLSPEASEKGPRVIEMPPMVIVEPAPKKTVLGMIVRGFVAKTKPRPSENQPSSEGAEGTGPTTAVPSGKVGNAIGKVDAGVNLGFFRLRGSVTAWTGDDAGIAYSPPSWSAQSRWGGVGLQGLGWKVGWTSSSDVDKLSSPVRLRTSVGSADVLFDGSTPTGVLVGPSGSFNVVVPLNLGGETPPPTSVENDCVSNGTC